MKMLYFSTVNWKWIKQRPHFISEYLAGEKVELEYISLTPFLKQKKHKRLQQNAFLFINDQYVIPLASKINVIQKINYIWISHMLNKAYDVITITHPEQYQYLIKALQYNPKVIYECMDNMPYFYEGNRRDEVIALEKAICNQVDHIITSSNFLKGKLIDEYGIAEEKITIINNAVDKHFIDQEHIDVTIEQPNLMYIGTIAGWIDFDILSQFAKKYPNYKIYMIGPKEQVPTTLPDNIIFKGSIPHKHIKSYIIKGDHVLIPFKVNQLIEAVDPVKMYEYLALGKHVITSQWEEMSKFKNKGHVSFYNNYEEFEKSVLAPSDIMSSYEYKGDFIRQHNWEKRGEQYLEVLSRLTAKR